MVESVADFNDWRTKARSHLLRGTLPSDVVWQIADDTQQFLFGSESVAEARGRISLPRAFIHQASEAARHRDPLRWTLLYRIAWRIVNEERNLLLMEPDDDVRALASLRKAVQYDTYKMRAFVRFRRVFSGDSEQFVAWYRPEHRTLDANERFFVDRFGGMRWAILTPDVSMMWDLSRVSYGPGVPRSEAPPDDEFEELWRTYYSSIYNPARLNLDAMRAQLPVRRWVDLPESRTIPELVRTSRGRLHSMTGVRSSASDLIQAGANVMALRSAVQRCNACELCAIASGPVFGEGPADARVMLIGEQPGDEEDRLRRPFVGPAGGVLDQALESAGLARSELYVTNAVKGFRHKPGRIHQTPGAGHIAKCRPWVEAEIAAVRPQTIVCLGATAAQSILGRAVRIGEERGRVTRRHTGESVVVTYHPSAALRARDDAGRVEIARALAHDLANVTI